MNRITDEELARLERLRGIYALEPLSRLIAEVRELRAGNERLRELAVAVREDFDCINPPRGGDDWTPNDSEDPGERITREQFDDHVDDTGCWHCMAIQVLLPTAQSAPQGEPNGR